jgi:hypothetical protein
MKKYFEINETKMGTFIFGFNKHHQTFIKKNTFFANDEYHFTIAAIGFFILWIKKV